MMKTAKMRQPHWLYIHNFYKYVSIKFVKMFSTIRTLSITYAANQQQRTEIRTADVVNWTAELELTLWMCGNQFGWILSSCVCRCLFVFFFIRCFFDWYFSVFFLYGEPLSFDSFTDRRNRSSYKNAIKSIFGNQ